MASATCDLMLSLQSRSQPAFDLKLDQVQPPSLRGCCLSVTLLPCCPHSRGDLFILFSFSPPFPAPTSSTPSTTPLPSHTLRLLFFEPAHSLPICPPHCPARFTPPHLPHPPFLPYLSTRVSRIIPTCSPARNCTLLRARDSSVRPPVHKTQSTQRARIRSGESSHSSSARPGTNFTSACARPASGRYAPGSTAVPYLSRSPPPHLSRLNSLKPHPSVHFY
jgi:hypothetical protein